MFKLILFFPLFLLLSFSGRASHIVGGDIYYDYLGNNQYRINVAIYRDCASTGAAFDSPLNLGVFNSNNVMVDQITINFPGSVNLPVVFDNPCVTTPSGICVERAIYSIIIFLPTTPGGYTVSYQRCCRGPNVTNLNNPDDTGLTLATHITGTDSNALINSSPRFTNYAPLVICNNEDLVMDHSATDPDGDSLSYQLVTPFAGANSINPMPVPIPPPNYPLVNWAGSFSPTNPLGAGSLTTINPVTGQLFVDANLLGLFVVGIRVNEYRNGVLIGSTTRDFLFRVVNCVIQLQANITEQEDMPNFVSYCQGLSFTFDNQSFGGSTYQWDFGVPGITTDVSTAFEPSYTYPAPGIYPVTLIVNPGWPCTDTAHMTLNLNNPLEVDFTFNDGQCFQNNSIDFIAQVTGDPGTTLQWTFGPNASIPTSTANPVNGVHFNTPVGNEVMLVGNFGVCSDTMRHTIVLLPQPVAQFNLPTNYECLGLTQSFDNTSLNSNQYAWDFGVPGTTTDVSTDTDPTFTFPAAGTYDITLVASIPGCTDTEVRSFTVYEPLTVSFTHNDSLCITTNSFNFVGTVTGPSITTYSWDFGPNSNPATASTLNVSNVVYSQPGQMPVTLTASFLNCSRSATDDVFVFREPTIDFAIQAGLQCAPFPAQFIDQSISDTPIQYSWSFGDGGTSTQENPLHIYTQPGQFPVTLKITTTEGCATTLSLTKDNIIFVHPTPVSDFDVNPKLTDICHSTITFTDQSQGGLYYNYVFDEENAVSQESNPAYTYTTPGMHYPLQIVLNEFGCSDTSRQRLFIEPYTIYIPNSFTPDGNEYNNDFITVAALEAVEWEFRIYDRWGQLVFLSSDQHEAWDGTYEGLPAPEGIYTYKLRYVSCAGGDRWEQLTGHVALLR